MWAQRLLCASGGLRIVRAHKSKAHGQLMVYAVSYTRKEQSGLPKREKHRTDPPPPPTMEGGWRGGSGPGAQLTGTMNQS